MQYSWSRASCVYEFFICPVCRHRCVAIAPLSPGTFFRDGHPDDFRETYRPGVVYERPETRDRQNRSVPGEVSSRKKPAREEGRNSAPRLRSYESYAMVSAADRIKNPGRKNPYDRPFGKVPSLFRFFVERKRSPYYFPSHHSPIFCETCKQWYIIFVTKRQEIAQCSRSNVRIGLNDGCARYSENDCYIYQVRRNHSRIYDETSMQLKTRKYMPLRGI